MNAIASYFAGGKKIDDLLSPILVKELRQGMRARVFVVSFLLLQVFLSILVFAYVEAQEDRGVLWNLDHYFWVIVGFALLALMPLRGLVTISNEMKGRTMETIMLTRLTAWRVVFGKWSALFAQSLLFVAAVLPYVVLRYFIGGDNVVSDFAFIFVLLWLSGMLIAASIAVSALGNIVIRVIILLGVIITATYGSAGFSSLWSSYPDTWVIVALLAIYGFFIPALLFELTASGIAPLSENHAVRRRLLALGFFGISWALGSYMSTDFQVGIVVPLVVLIGICYYDLSEKPRLLPRMIETQSRKLGPVRILGLFLLPGWPSALLFSLIVIPAAMGVCYQFVPPNTNAGWLLPIFAVLGSVLLPVLVCHLFWPRMNQVLLTVVLYNVILMAVTSILEGFVALTHAHVDVFFAFLPSLPVLTVAMNADDHALSDYGELYVFGNSAVIGALIIGLLASSRRYFRELSALSRAARNSEPTPPSGESAPATP